MLDTANDKSKAKRKAGKRSLATKPKRTRARNRDLNLHRIASRLYRQRQRDGDFVLHVPVNREVLGWLIEKACWVSEADAATGDRVRLGLLVGEGLALSARTKRRPEDDH